MPSLRTALPLVAVSVLGSLGGCGGPPSPTHDVTVLPSASGTASNAPVVDLAPVPMPESVILLVHAAHVGPTADVVADWAGQPLGVDDQLGEMVGERLAKLVDLDASADLVVIAKDRGGHHDPDIRFAVGLPVKGFDSAKATLQAQYGLVPMRNGAFELTRTGEHRRDGDHDFRSCALAPSEGGARIVCSRDAALRDSVLPFLTRGLAAYRDSKSDVHVEARPGPFTEMVRRERADITQSGARSMGGHLQGAWEGIISDLCDSFLDVDKASLDAVIDAKSGALSMTLSAKGGQGAITRLLTSHPNRAEPPPASFMRLPSDADIAFFAHGLDAAELTSPKAVALKALEVALADEPKLKDADRGAFLEAVGHTIDLLTAPVVVYGRGVDFNKAVPAVSGLTEGSDAAKIKAGLEQAAGWDVIGADADPTKVAAVFKEWTGVLSRPGIKAAINDDKTTLRVVGAVRNAPAGTLEVSLTSSHEDWDSASSTGKPKKRPPITLTLHTLIVPDQNRVWVVSALDEATAVARAQALVAGTSTLATRAGLDALKAARLNAGGFSTPRGVGLGTPLTWLFHYNPRYRAANDPLMGISSQSQYTTPVIFTAAEGAAGSGTSLTLGLRFPRPALQDVLQVGPRLFH